MSISPQTKSVLKRLHAGETLSSGDVTVGPFTAPTKLLLSVLADHRNDLQGRTGADQATRLCSLYAAKKEAVAEGEADGESSRRDEDAESEIVHDAESHRDANEPSVATSSDTAPADRAWCLWSVTCQSIRGVAPVGETLEFSFDGRSTLIFGPNGSGKSSLLGAIVWVLTGRVILDAHEQVESTPIHRVARDSAKGSKICDWPVVATLPLDGEPSSGSATCMGELELRSEDGKSLWIRRALPNQVECSSDHSSWTRGADLTDWGIEPLDLQLSLLAPTVFGRLTVEQAPDTRTLLSLMLGYDDLEALGELASKLGRNRTTLANKETVNVSNEKRVIRDKLAALPGLLAEDSARCEQLEELSRQGCPAKADIADAGKCVGRDIEAAEASLGELLELDVDGDAPPAGLAEHLTSAIADLEKGVGHNFTSLNAIALDSLLPETDAKTSSERLAEVMLAFEEFTEESRSRIANRLVWSRKEAVGGSKLVLRLRAAQDFDPDQAVCPVCDQSVKHLPIEDELASLKTVDPELQRELRDFFRDLRSELETIVAPSLAALGEQSPGERVIQDWITLRDNALGASLLSISSRYEDRVRGIAEEISTDEPEPLRLIPDDAELGFRAAAQEFVERATKVRNALAILSWSAEHLSDIQTALDALIISSPSQNGESLLTALSRGKEAAQEIHPLTSIHKQLRQIYKDRDALRLKEEQIGILDELQSPLDDLKLLSKYAAEEVGQIFGSIRDKTVENWKKLYPETSTGLAPARLHMGSGRNKSVESLLAGGHCEVPGQFFANAGLQRAIALSFLFALLDRHPRGLGFILLDDPILSLDDEHRECWSANVLHPWIGDLQFIVATHQRQYLNHCRHHFRTGKVVELNPRTRVNRITWRPGDRLECASADLERNPANVPNQLRKFAEEILLTLDSYSPDSFVVTNNYPQSVQNYAQLTVPHPLAGSRQQQLAQHLLDQKVKLVLNPGSHAETEANVTTPMARDCLLVLRTCDKLFRQEVECLERRRMHELRRSSIPVTAIRFPVAMPQSSWDEPVAIPLLGHAAARPDSMTLLAEEEMSRNEILPGYAVLVAADTIDPVARIGQWVLLAEEDTPSVDGDIVAISTADGGRLLRRMWSDGDKWLLQSVNPVRPAPSVILRKLDGASRKVVGVLYDPPKQPRAASSSAHDEWHPRGDFDPSRLSDLKMVKVVGDSLDPIARRDQSVLVGRKQSAEDVSVESGGLAVIETKNDSVGCVIKRVFRLGDRWILISSNPVEPHEPIVVSTDEISGVWPLHGVLFESFDYEVT